MTSSIERQTAFIIIKNMPPFLLYLPMSRLLINLLYRRVTHYHEALFADMRHLAAPRFTVYWENFASLNFREFHVSFPIRENLFREILGGVAHY